MALNRFRNAFWKFFSSNAVVSTEVQRGIFSPDADLEKLSDRYMSIKDTEAAGLKAGNVLDLMLKNARSDWERKELALYKAIQNAAFFEDVDYAQLIESYDAIQVLKNLELIQKTEAPVDPEIVEYETLKAKYLLNEEGAEEKLKEYVRNRPVVHPYNLWSSPEEKHNVRLWFF